MPTDLGSNLIPTLAQLDQWTFTLGVLAVACAGLLIVWRLAQRPLDRLVPKSLQDPPADTRRQQLDAIVEAPKVVSFTQPAAKGFHRENVIALNARDPRR